MLYECPNTVLKRYCPICEVLHGLVSDYIISIPNSTLTLEGRWKSAINFTNNLGSQGRLAGSFARLLHEMWGGDLPYVSPIDFRVSLSKSVVFLLLIIFRKQFVISNRSIMDRINMTRKSSSVFFWMAFMKI